MKFVKNCEKLTKEELKSINGGNFPYCPVGKICYRGDDANGLPIWDCVPQTTLCPTL
ncbi:bacteriocin [uncultured Flavobacterium sp.]|jgi:bacteriocin-like protein|uniref:bacteriocin n=1 Tax=uncultured Flavobacterium sp. TaxID=165435 RepID=UPI0030816721